MAPKEAKKGGTINQSLSRRLWQHMCESEQIAITTCAADGSYIYAGHKCYVLWYCLDMKLTDLSL